MIAKLGILSKLLLEGEARTMGAGGKGWKIIDKGIPER